MFPQGNQRSARISVVHISWHVCQTARLADDQHLQQILNRIYKTIACKERNQNEIRNMLKKYIFHQRIIVHTYIELIKICLIKSIPVIRKKIECLYDLVIKMTIY